MKQVELIGTLETPAGSAVILTVSGPNHHTMTSTFHDNFSLPLAVITGDYYITLSVFTTGTFTLDITGDCQNMMPQVPFKFTGHRQTFYLNVS